MVRISQTGYMEMDNIQTYDEIIRIATVTSEYVSEAKSVESAETPSLSANPSGIISFVDLIQMDLPEPHFIIDQILPEGLCVLSGAPKIGKSWLAMNLTTAIAQGSLALGRFDCSQGTVLHASLEDSPRRFGFRIRKVIGSSPVPTGAYFTNSLPPVEVQGKGATCADILQKWLEDYRESCRLIVIDTFQKIRPSKSRQDTLYQSDYKDLEPLKQLADTYSICVLVVHHDRKQPSEDPFHRISGSTGITGSADTVWMLQKQNRRTTKGTLFVSGRDLEERTGAVSFNGGLWTWDGEDSEVQMSQESQAIRSILIEEGRPLTIREISDGLQKGYDATKHLVYKMQGRGEIEKALGNKWMLPPEDVAYGSEQRAEKGDYL